MKPIIKGRQFMIAHMVKIAQPMVIYGNTPAACDYSIVDENGNMLDGRIVLQ